MFNFEEILPTSRGPCIFKKIHFPSRSFLIAGIRNEHKLIFSSVGRGPIWILLCGHRDVSRAAFLLEDRGLFFLGVTALLTCGLSNLFSPAVARVRTSPSPAVTFLTPALTSEDPWDYIAPTPVPRMASPGVGPFCNHTHTRPFCMCVNTVTGSGD